MEGQGQDSQTVFDSVWHSLKETGRSLLDPARELLRPPPPAAGPKPVGATVPTTDQRRVAVAETSPGSPVVHEGRQDSFDRLDAEWRQALAAVMICGFWQTHGLVHRDPTRRTEARIRRGSSSGSLR
jgi:hypothetical protein